MTADSSTAGFRHFHDQLSSLKETLLTMSSKANYSTTQLQKDGAPLPAGSLVLKG